MNLPGHALGHQMVMVTRLQTFSRLLQLTCAAIRMLTDN